MNDHKIKLLSGILGAMLFAALLGGCAVPGEKDKERLFTDAPQTEPTVVSEAPETQTEPPTVTETPDPQANDDEPWSLTVAESRVNEYAAAAHEMLDGNVPEKRIFGADPCGVFFELGADGTYACTLLFDIFRLPDEESAHLWKDYYFCGERIASYPAELADDMLRSVFENRKERFQYDDDELDPYSGMPGGGFMGYGFAGENYTVLLGEEVGQRQNCAVFWLDGEEWREIDSSGLPLEHINGAAVLDPKTCFVCMRGKDIEEGRGFSVYSTSDGGSSWAEIPIPVPEEFSDYGASDAFSPVFEGDEGVMLIELYYPSTGDGINCVQLWYRTVDRGSTWTLCGTVK